MEEKSIIRRSISIPKELDDQIEIMKKEFSYSVKNELIIELMELGILKYKEDIELKNKLDKFLKNMDLILNKLGIK